MKILNGCESWLGGRDSNPDKQSQSLVKPFNFNLFGRLPPSKYNICSLRSQFHPESH